MSYLYRYECKGIQEWILAGGKLRDIAAASNLIEEVPVERAALCEKLVCNPKVLAEAAGGGTLEFASRAELEKFAAEWPMHMDAYAPGLHVVQAWVVKQAGSLELDGLYMHLASARQQLHPELPQVGPLVEIAGRTGLPAVKIRRATSDRGQFLDRAGVAKERCFDAKDFLLSKKFGAHQFIDADKDLAEGMVAVVHADGNRIGAWIQQSKPDSDAFAKFSEALNAANEAAVKSATDKLYGARQAKGTGDKPLPLRPILLGGDDVTVLIDGAAAVPWTVAYLQAFEDESERRMKGAGFDKGFTACAGIAWCKSHWPFHQALEVAESLCKAAKAGLKTGNDTQSGLLWHRILGSTETEWSEIRRLELGNGRLVGGPWRLADLSVLQKLAEAVADRSIPRGALRRWIDLESRADNSASEREADELWQRTRTVQEQKADGKPWFKFLALLEELGIDRQTRRPTERNSHKSTPLFDALTWARLQPGKDKLWTANAVQGDQ
jgi:hypothetical protein